MYLDLLKGIINGQSPCILDKDVYSEVVGHSLPQIMFKMRRIIM